MPYPRFQKARDFKFARRTSSSIVANNTSWANVDTGLDLTLNNVNVGDVIEYIPSMYVGNEAILIYFDVATIVSGSPVNQFGSRGAVDNSHCGWAGWTGPASAYMSIGTPAYYALQAGDISSGSVTLRFRYRTNTAGSKSLYCAATQPIDVFARNLGPVDPH